MPFPSFHLYRARIFQILVSQKVLCGKLYEGLWVAVHGASLSPLGSHVRSITILDAQANSEHLAFSF